MSKKEVTLTIVAVVTLIALVAGATYAYFAVGVNTEGFTTQNINANAESVGNVILTKTGNGIYLNLSRVNMMKQYDKYDNQTPIDVTYYGVNTPTGTPVTTMNRIPIGTATVTGEGNYTCTYSLTVTNANSSAANNMYTAFQNWKANGYRENNVVVSPSSNATTGQIVLNVGGTEYDFYNANVFNTKATGTLSNITSENAKTIEAYMYVKNDGNKNQNAIAGTEINIEVTVDLFSCTAVTAPPQPRTEYWTYEGTNVTYASASPKYTEANKSQIPNNYYVKTTLTPTVATEETWAIYESGVLNSSYGTFANQSACESFINGAPDTITCGEITGQTYEVPTHEVCAKFNSEVCISNNNWENASEMMASMKAAGATYCNDETYESDSYLECLNKPLENGLVATGSLYCDVYIDGAVTCSAMYENYSNRCYVYPDGRTACEYVLGGV